MHAFLAGQTGHATPKVDVRAFAFREERVLLIRNLDDGLWAPPGGWAEVGERPGQAAEKELREESGYAGRAVKLIGLYDRDLRGRRRWPFHGYSAHFLCRLSGADPGEIDRREASEAGFFSRDELPELSVRVRQDQVATAFAHLDDPHRPAHFD